MPREQRTYRTVALLIPAPFSPGRDDPDGAGRCGGDVAVSLTADRVGGPLKLSWIGRAQGEQVHELQAAIPPSTAEAGAPPHRRVIGPLVSRAWIEEDPEQARAVEIPGPPQEVATRADDEGTAAYGHAE